MMLIFNLSKDETLYNTNLKKSTFNLKRKTINPSFYLIKEKKYIKKNSKQFFYSKKLL